MCDDCSVCASKRKQKYDDTPRTPEAAAAWAQSQARKKKKKTKQPACKSGDSHV